MLRWPERARPLAAPGGLLASPISRLLMVTLCMCRGGQRQFWTLPRSRRWPGQRMCLIWPSGMTLSGTCLSA